MVKFDEQDKSQKINSPLHCMFFFYYYYYLTNHLRRQPKFTEVVSSHMQVIAYFCNWLEIF